MPRDFREGESCKECGTTEKKHHALGLCVNCYARKARRENPERQKELNKKYEQSNKRKKWLKEYKKGDTYKTMMKKSSKKYRDANKEAVHEATRKWRKENKDRIHEYERKTETVLRQRNNNLIRKYGSVSLEVLERDNNECQKCGKKEAHLHHIDWDKTNNTLENLIVLCNPCHTKSHRWIPVELRRELFEEWMKLA